MNGTIRLFDYRCFSREHPAALTIEQGFAAFVGPNNAGKSALLRSVYELRPVFEVLAGNIAGGAKMLGSTFGYSTRPPLYEATDIFADRPMPQCAVELLPDISHESDGDHVARARIEFFDNSGNFRVRLLDSSGVDLGSQSPKVGRLVGFDGTTYSLLSESGRRFSARALIDFIRVLLDAQFVGPFRNAVNEGAGAYFDAQIGTGFIAQWHSWKTGPTKSQNRAIERVTEDIRELLGVRSLEISASSDQKTLHVSVDRRPHKLQELGSGIAQLIVVLGGALIRKPSYVLIDEPELHLHPGLQSKFVAALGSYTQHGVLFATHSIGLARAVADRCFTVQRSDEGSVVRPIERTPNYAEFLGSLGIAGLQEVGWDRVLLVEGPKDVRTFQQLLRKYGKDQRTVVLPLGGDSMVNGKTATELSEMLRLGSRVAAVVDSERDAQDARPKKAREDFAEVCRSLSIDCCVTQRRAIENYLSSLALQAAFGPSQAALGPYDKPDSIAPFWGKGESWRAAKEMSREELDRTDIGEFLAKL